MDKKKKKKKKNPVGLRDNLQTMRDSVRERACARIRTATRVPSTTARQYIYFIILWFRSLIRRHCATDDRRVRIAVCRWTLTPAETLVRAHKWMIPTRRSTTDNHVQKTLRVLIQIFITVSSPYSAVFAEWRTRTTHHFHHFVVAVVLQNEQ